MPALTPQQLEDAGTNPARLDNPALRNGLIRLAGFAQAVLEQHHATGHRRCPACRHTHTSRHTPCAVLPLTSLYLLEPLDVTWWQTLNHHGRNITLDETRAWLNARKIQNTSAANDAE